MSARVRVVVARDINMNANELWNAVIAEVPGLMIAFKQKEEEERKLRERHEKDWTRFVNAFEILANAIAYKPGCIGASVAEESFEKNKGKRKVRESTSTGKKRK